MHRFNFWTVLDLQTAIVKYQDIFTEYSNCSPSLEKHVIAVLLCTNTILWTLQVYNYSTGNGWQQNKPFEIVRQSQPWGTVSGDSGLFFIGYAASPENFEFMLDRMVGAGGDGHSDLIMTLTSCVKGTYWYFPSVPELKRMAWIIKEHNPCSLTSSLKWSYHHLLQEIILYLHCFIFLYFDLYYMHFSNH